MKKIVALVFICCCFVIVALTDFAVIPTVFRTLGDPQTAGRIGIKLFSLLNPIELGLLLGVGFLSWERSIKYLIMFYSLVIIVSTQLFYLTPQIKIYAEKMFNASTVENQINDHFQVLHKSYVYLDGGKIVFLLALMILLFLRVKKENGR